MPEFNVGDRVWFAKYERQSVNKECPICSGKMRVTVILGNGDHIETDCTYCERGFQKYGYVVEYDYVSAVQQVEITQKSVSENENGRHVEYRYENWCLSLDNAFSTKEEAEARLQEKIAEAKAQDLEKTEYTKNQNPRKYSWDVGYYQRQKKDALKTIERCDRKITYFKSKAKEQKQEEHKLTHCLRCSSPLASYEKEHCSQCQWHIKEYGE